MKQNGCTKRVRPSRHERLLHGARFKVMCADAGLSIEQTAKVLHVTRRTVQLWISGRVRIPYAAYRLVRILGRYELPDPGWAGWVFHSGKLWSPEGHGFNPHDSNWWGLLVRQARAWKEMSERQAQFDVLMLRAGRVATGAADAAGGTADRATALPTGAAGRAAEPPGPNLLLGHFGTGEACFRGENPSSRVAPPALAAANKVGRQGAKR